MTQQIGEGFSGAHPVHDLLSFFQWVDRLGNWVAEQSLAWLGRGAFLRLSGGLADFALRGCSLTDRPLLGGLGLDQIHRQHGDECSQP
ncbi:MAG TPA: hypothetical protein VKR81_14115 [Candidatus Binatia bacterium]|nr:hypothetical protein [Candidatus Binatia bacterium]